VVALTPGRLLTIPPGVPHRVRGIDESAFLLTIGGAPDRS
jgi:quercetin dioxygenase-like cupin family protein